MATEIVDLDEALGPDKRVRLKGKTHRLPAEIPVELHLRIKQASTDGIDDAGMIDVLYEQVLELFRHGDPKMDKLPPMGLGQLVGLIGRVYGQDAEAEEPARPTRATSGGRSSKSRAASRSRSSR